MTESVARSVSTTRTDASHRNSRYTARFEELVRAYDGSPLPVSFRELVGPLPANEGAHQAHPYPARLVRQVPRFLLSCEQMSAPGDLVFDPFCGSGTVLLESRSSLKPSWGTDANPLATLIARVKVHPVDMAEAHQALDRVVRSSTRMREDYFLDVFLDRWFSTSTRSALDVIRRAIKRHTTGRIQDALMLGLSLTAERLAHKDPRIPVPVRRPEPMEHHSRGAVIGAFRERCLHVLSRVPTKRSPSGAASDVFTARAQDCLEVSSSAGLPTTKLILTSPPYGAAQKYIRSSAISLAVLGLANPSQFAALNRSMTGREWIAGIDRVTSTPPQLATSVRSVLDDLRERAPRRYEIYAAFFEDMRMALNACMEVLAPAGHFILVSSDNTVAGRHVPTHELLAEMLDESGCTRVLSLEDRIAGRRLMTKRANSAAQPIRSEYVHVFRKVGE